MCLNLPHVHAAADIRPVALCACMNACMQAGGVTAIRKLVESLQQGIRRARDERDREVRESDALFSQLQDLHAAKQVRLPCCASMDSPATIRKPLLIRPFLTPPAATRSDNPFVACRRRWSCALAWPGC
jgi:hypothetical protein